MAKFKGKDIAFIRGRGVVVFGDVVEGAVKIGMKLVLPDGEFAVTGIELATCIDDEGKHYTQSGLLLNSDKAARESFWALLAVRGVIFEVRE